MCHRSTNLSAVNSILESVYVRFVRQQFPPELVGACFYLCPLHALGGGGACVVLGNVNAIKAVREREGKDRGNVRHSCVGFDFPWIVIKCTGKRRVVVEIHILSEGKCGLGSVLRTFCSELGEVDVNKPPSIARLDMFNLKLIFDEIGRK